MGPPTDITPRDKRILGRSPKQLRSMILHVALVCCVITLALLALLPSGVVKRSSFGGHVEHFIAYLGTTLVMGLAYRSRPRLILRCGMLVAYAAILEMGQLYSPGRHAAFSDFVFSSSGVVVGGLLVWMAVPRVCTWLRID